ncbi:MAG: 2-oxoacid:acceptor oxidoreductase family protein [Coriobacteriia bacterium]|nr:2-oxoacid:acceptor oxidoreductase family protein [Coriobacteriia bacterium]MCL2750137.1 2-oxoacid:acceptor oxidoreductase family protein [Coriobacteriia bacterium]
MKQDAPNATGIKELKILLAGFGGQGILFAGKVIAYAGLMDGHEVSWMPSYGPEMRGGAANCSVIISDIPIGSPLATEPDVLIALNVPSYESFVNRVKPGGLVLIDKTIVDVCPLRTDIQFVGIEATRLAENSGLKGLANVVAIGKLLQLTGFSTLAQVEKAIDKSITSKYIDKAASNKKALSLGFEHVSDDDCAH